MNKYHLGLALMLIGIFGLVTVTAFADETTQTVSDNKAVVAVEKQPTNKNNKQTVKNNWFSIVIVVNGKVKDTVTPKSAR